VWNPEEQKREFAPFELSARDVMLCLSPNGRRQCLGEGGFGAVYKALMNNVDEVAVKMVRGHNPSAQQKQSFLQEIRVLSMLRHRNIVQFYGARIRPDCTFFVTEMMKGGDLYSVMRKHQDTMKYAVLVTCSTAHERANSDVLFAGLDGSVLEGKLHIS